MNSADKRSFSLQAYCDGELSRFARWRMEHRLRRSPELRRELAEWVELSRWIREIDAADSTHHNPNTWLEIGPALSRIDREIESKRGANGSKVPREDASARTWLGGNWASLAATGAVAALALAVVSLNSEDPSPDYAGSNGGREVAKGSLRYLKTNGVSYVVARDSDDVTIIWLMDSDAAPEGV